MSAPWSVVELGEWIDPAAVHAHLHHSSDPVFWLDAGPDAHEGWSWVGTGVEETDPARVREVRLATATPREAPGGPFRGGWVGWSGYDAAAARAGAPVTEEGRSDRWMRVTRFVAFDHACRQVWVHAPSSEAERFAAEVRTSTAPTVPVVDPPRAVAHARHTPEEYGALIEHSREAIRRGDAYQLCLTTRFTVEGEADATNVFARLRTATPAHHGGVVSFGSDALISASPERFLEVSGGVVRTHPIKGTRPRGADAASDSALATELRESEKERAENVMIVDLMRNDLSRVCNPGTVRVERLLAVESYPAVHQLVSTVAGDLRPETTVGELWDASFPAGSMTGAPKLSAMTILHALEGGPRGVFAGCFGWVGADGALDLAMVIRSVTVHPGGAYVGAGGGITWRSEADAEIAEVAVKARGPLEALGARLPPGWDDAAG